MTLDFKPDTYRVAETSLQIIVKATTDHNLTQSDTRIGEAERDCE